MIVEERIYRIRNGRMGRYLQLVREEGLAIQQPILGGLVGYFTTDIGPLNQVTHLWAYADLQDRARRRQQLGTIPVAGFPAQAVREHRAGGKQDSRADGLFTVAASVPFRGLSRGEKAMTERLKIEHLYKVFTDKQERALAMLNAGKNKSEVQETLGQVVGLDDVSLSVPSGSMYMIMELSGSGKSTLVRCINRLNEPSAGKILLDDEDICTLDEAGLRDVRRNRISMVFQHFALLPNRHVIENVEFGLKLRGMSAGERRKRAEEVLSVVDLARWAYNLPHELSGGIRQRVGLARALATDADMLIMDEAFSALDLLIRTEMQDELLRLQCTLSKTILFITHNFQEALKLGSRIAIMSEGRLVREGTPQSIVLEPGSDYVAAFTREVDRRRLFDAGSVTTSLVTILRSPNGIVLGDASGEPGPGFMLDANERILGTVTASEIELARGGAMPRPDTCFTCVPAHTKLVDVVSRYRAGGTIGVIDDTGRLIGRLEARQILAGIGAPGAAGVRHVN